MFHLFLLSLKLRLTLSFLIFSFKVLIYYLIIFPCNYKFNENDPRKSANSMKTIQESLQITEIIKCIPSMFYVIDLSLIILNTSWGIYSVPKKIPIRSSFSSINNETLCVLLLFLSLKFMTYALSFIVGKLSLAKDSMKTSFVIEILSNVTIA